MDKASQLEKTDVQGGSPSESGIARGICFESYDLAQELETENEGRMFHEDLGFDVDELRRLGLGGDNQLGEEEEIGIDSAISTSNAAVMSTSNAAAISPFNPAAISTSNDAAISISNAAVMSTSNPSAISPFNPAAISSFNPAATSSFNPAAISSFNPAATSPFAPMSTSNNPATISISDPSVMSTSHAAAISTSNAAAISSFNPASNPPFTPASISTFNSNATASSSYHGTATSNASSNSASNAAVDSSTHGKAHSSAGTSLAAPTAPTAGGASDEANAGDSRSSSPARLDLSQEQTSRKRKGLPSSGSADERAEGQAPSDNEATKRRRKRPATKKKKDKQKQQRKEKEVLRRREAAMERQELSEVKPHALKNALNATRYYLGEKEDSNTLPKYQGGMSNLEEGPQPSANFDASSLPQSKPGWIGVKEMKVEDLESVKDFSYINWDGKETILLLDRKDRIIAVLGGAPPGARDWKQVIEEASKAFRLAHEASSYTFDELFHRRGWYAFKDFGYSFGGGQTKPTNIDCHGKKNEEEALKLANNPAVLRVVRHIGILFQTFAHKMALKYKELRKDLEERDPKLRAPPYGNPGNPGDPGNPGHPDGGFWAAATQNRDASGNVIPRERDEFGNIIRRNRANRNPENRNVHSTPTNQGESSLPLHTSVVAFPHKDYNNYAPGWCTITPFGDFDADNGGDLILFELRLRIRFPPGATIMFPSALITHCNIPIRQGETRHSLVQYTAGGLFRWKYNNFKSDKQVEEEGNAIRDLGVKTEFFRKRSEDRKVRWKKGLQLYTHWYEHERGDYKRDELGDLSEVSSISSC